ncbi:MAG: DUF4013 domain-containing protein [Candidatus Dormibacteraeota bacterium]|nr:DUF4013 domain-containing protein [Candidatus Dormibacteraeota bacterium]
MNSLSDTLAWPARDSQWVSKILVMGLIGLLALVPVVGTVIVALVYLGWVFSAIDNLRAGRYELPPAGFGYLGRGGPPFLVLVVYGLVVAVLFVVFYVPGIVLLGVGGSDHGPGALAGLGALLIALGLAVGFVGGLGLGLLHPVILRRTYYWGIGGGLDFRAVISEVRARPGDTLLCGVFAIIALLIGQLGSALCIVGVIFTQPYGYAMLAGVVRYYDQTVSGTEPGQSGYAIT